MRAFIERAVRFAAVGLGATALYAAIGLCALALGAGTMTAHAIAYAISITASYFGQKVFTFGVRGEHRRMGPRFALATVFLMLTQTAMVWALDRAGVDPTWVLLAATAYYPPASFLVHSYWTFRKPLA